MHAVYADERVTGGSLNVTLTLSLAQDKTLTLLKETLNLCDLLTELHYPCPVSPGHFMFNKHDTVVTALPKVTMHIASVSLFLLCFTHL